MVRAPGAAPAPGSGLELPDATWGYLARRGVPAFAAEGLLPLLVFYGAWRTWGSTAAIVVATLLAASIALWQARRGREAPVAWITLVFLVVQAVVGIAAHSATVYLAQPVVLSAGWGVAYLASAAAGRPLVGVFAQAWYPFPADFRATAVYRREFGMQSVVWGVFCLARAGLRLAALLGSGIGGFVLVSLATGTPVFVALVAWGVWHARQTFSRGDLPDVISWGRVG